MTSKTPIDTQQQQQQQQQLPTSSSPTPSPLSTNISYISKAKQTLYNHLARRRPWRQVFDYHSLSLPQNLSTSMTRLKTNLGYFRLNFAIIILIALFLSLLWSPYSLIVFLIMMVAWTFLFFLRDEPLVVFRRTVDDRVVLAVLSVLTVAALLFTGATLNILSSLAVGFAVVLVYSLLRKTDDLYLDEDDAAGAGLLSARV